MIYEVPSPRQLCNFSPEICPLRKCGLMHEENKIYAYTDKKDNYLLQIVNSL